MATNGSSMRCADGSLGQQRHVCAFFNDLDEEHRRLIRQFGFARIDRRKGLVQ